MTRPYKKPLMTVPEVAAIFEVQPITIREWCRSGILDAVRPGRDWKIRRASVEALVQSKFGSSEDE